MKRSLWHKHPAISTDLTMGERAADFLKHWFGTWIALGSVGGAIVFWIIIQRADKFDPYPFILLNLCLSCLAAVQGIILQISANRGDRISSEVALHTRDRADELLQINQNQLGILDNIKDIHLDLARVEGKIDAWRKETREVN